MRIFTVGETTYDISFRNGVPVGSCSGGSAYNSAISLGRCGLPVSLITTFGNDRVGDLSLSFLQNNGVNCSLIKRFEGQSRIALAFFDEKNNAEYSFYQASKEVIPDYPEPKENDIVLLGSSFAIRDNGRDNLLGFLKKVRVAGGVIIYDPNARQSMIHKPESINRICQNIGLANLIKGSDQDFLHIFDLKNGSDVYSRISTLGEANLIYTKGAMGSELFTKKIHFEIAANACKVVSTIGAGDNFSAGIVWGIYTHLNNHLVYTDLTENVWQTIMKTGTFFASEVCGSSANYMTREVAQNFVKKSL